VIDWKTLVIVVITWLLKRYITVPQMDTLKEIRGLQEEADEVTRKIVAAMRAHPKYESDYVGSLKYKRMLLNRTIAKLRRNLGHN
jgi:hypothetical protein